MKRMRRGPFPKVVLALSLFLPAAVASPGPASAGHPKTTSGDVNFEADEAFFTRFPCETSCQGLIKGSWYGGISGAIDADQNPDTIDSQEFTVSWATTHVNEPRKWHMQFTTHDELCDVADAAGTVTGSATGSVSATAAGAVDEVVGQIGAVLINSVTLTSTFTWMRTGNGAAIDFNAPQVWITTAVGSHLIVDRGQTGSVSFLGKGASTPPLTPTSPPPPPPPPGCDSPITNLSIEAAGHIAVVTDPVDPPFAP